MVFSASGSAYRALIENNEVMSGDRVHEGAGDRPKEDRRGRAESSLTASSRVTLRPCFPHTRGVGGPRRAGDARPRHRDSQQGRSDGDGRERQHAGTLAVGEHLFEYAPAPATSSKAVWEIRPGPSSATGTGLRIRPMNPITTAVFHHTFVTRRPRVRSTARMRTRIVPVMNAAIGSLGEHLRCRDERLVPGD